MFGVTASSIQKFRAMRFSSTAYVDVGSNSSLNFERTDSFTISARIRAAPGVGSGVIFIRRGPTSGGGDDLRGFATSIQSTGIFRFNLYSNLAGGNGININTTTTGYDDNHWHNVIFTYDGSSTAAGINVYVDNVSQGKSTVIDSLSTSIAGTRTAAIGRDPVQSASELIGNLDDVMVFSGVVNSGTRSSIYNGGKPPTKASILALSGLISYWRMGEGVTSTTMADEKGSNTGTLTNATTANLIYYTKPF